MSTAGVDCYRFGTTLTVGESTRSWSNGDMYTYASVCSSAGASDNSNSCDGWILCSCVSNDTLCVFY